MNITYGQRAVELMYWRENNDECDYLVTQHGNPTIAIEVKSGRKKKIVSTERLLQAVGECPFLVVDLQNIEQFLRTNSVQELVDMQQGCPAR